MSIPYLPNQATKPLSVSDQGIVTFTDGTNPTIPNEEQCLAYGYTYDKTTGTCRAFTAMPNLPFNLQNENINIQGAGNIVRGGSNNTYMMGEKNVINGASRNNIIIGMQNQIANGVNNAFVYGTLAEATTDNSIILGGNNAADILGERQNITFIYGGQTTNASSPNLYLNNTTDSFFQPKENAVFYFQAETIAVNVAGAGAAGDYKSWVERGVVKNARGTLSIQRSQTAIVDSGTTTGWTTENTISGSDFKQTVTGAVGMTIEWASTIRITEIRTSVTLT